ncbi:hypothetical protein GUJ93_ZPchr0005g16123 [Zizania palustris]|uniref:Uncharacterized protein n=1 Tax=Zizania palustris TaxID=103762 RepID=A0A8J5W0I9_ZIZPA|nr:hypothetical protein GUJ93_ZPchr0005g14516 [Zizania palustris]KAG8067871.1 hypothetical protein GUJ93_ZPchr0005g16123 [Zizania palustris]
MDAVPRAGDVEDSRGGGDGDGAATTVSSARRAEEEEGRKGEASAAAAAAAASAGEDELQVERFYALLANIRALRGMYRDAATAVTGDDDEVEDVRGGVGPSRKRARCAEPPWRPEFRMEDFEEPAADDAGCSTKKQRGVGGVSDVGKRRPGKEAAAAEEDGEVVSGKARQAAASQRAGPLAS